MVREDATWIRTGSEFLKKLKEDAGNITVRVRS